MQRPVNPETAPRPGEKRRTAQPVRFHPSHVQLPASEGLHAQRLYELIGREAGQDEVAQRVRAYVQSLRPPVTGALQLCCADEAEQDALDAFHRGFVRYVLPSMRFADKAQFGLRGLGARYEWGAVAVAEDHYALAAGAEDWKVMVHKVNAHVSVSTGAEGRAFGRMARYQGDSTYCGALHAVLAGADAPFARALAEDFAFEGEDRLAPLRDPSVVDPGHAPLFAAIVSARQQARRLMLDVQELAQRSPTLHLVVPCVSLNRQDRDSELFLGVYTADRRGEEAHDEWTGLGDDPRAYEVVEEGSGLRVTDGETHAPRAARDHRKLVLERWAARRTNAETQRPDPQLERALAEALAERAAGRPLKKALTATVLGLALEVAPIPAAVLLFGQGLLGIHHAQRAHKLTRAAADDASAREMLSDIRTRVDDIPPDTAQHVVDLLLNEYGR